MESLARPLEFELKVIGAKSSQNGMYFIFKQKSRGIRSPKNENSPHNEGGCLQEVDPGRAPRAGAMVGGAAVGEATEGGAPAVGAMEGGAPYTMPYNVM